MTAPGSSPRALLAQATPRPWYAMSDTADMVCSREKGCIADMTEPADARLIVAAVNSYEALLDVAEAATSHRCADWAITADEGTSYCRMCAALARVPAVREKT